MATFFNTPIKILDAINDWTGKTVAWLTTVLVVFMCYDVTMRYLFNQTAVWISELEWHLFSLIFLLAAAYTLKEDKHVRVDVFYAEWSPKRKALLNLLGTIFFLIPFCLIVISSSFSYAEKSWMIGESSADPGGLPARYLIKSAITLGFVLLLIQSFAELMRSLSTLISSRQNHA
ncbi:MAG: TRAP transporter small permease subunit [Bacteroidia bacterium]|nr:TRAP transporter small permease subunit [Bacteroidia bacterium]